MNRYLSRLINTTLQNKKETRDDWMLLVKEVHDKEMSLWCFERDNYYEAFFSEKLSNVCTIVRLWRLIQEKCPELRGDEWEQRQRQGGLMAKEIIDDNQLKLWE
jgi:hypothetical protein